ncbi:trypsin-like peptidase domain-containing protein [Candidatus Parcubacteria bacterium]|nr:trypsin-like peptidase domain-containing protein [Candidatus Parcubacteria bacterium]
MFYDHEEGKAYGEYPKKFPMYANKKQCSDDDIKLGEPVRVYGYPAITGGYALTITDGVVSSLLIDEGLIITSAKISYGNSGGLAVDQNGCMIGIPSMIIGDENESFGVIISNDIINEFIARLELLK